MASCRYKSTNKVLGYGKYGTNQIVEYKSKKYASQTFTPDTSHQLINPDEKFKLLKSGNKYNTFINPLEVDIPFRLKSPNLLTGEYIAEVNECDFNSPAIITNLYENTLISDLKLFDFNDKLSIIKGIVRALQCLHRNRYLHLNCILKNCLYKKEGRGYEGILVDYSQSAYCRDGVDKGILTELPRTKGVYKAPETLVKVDGKRYLYTNKADIWSLGMLIIKIFTNNFDILYESIHDDLEKGDFASLGEFYREYMNKETIRDFIDDIIIPKISEIHREIEDPEKKAQARSLLLATLHIDPAERSNIDGIAKIPFLKIETEPGVCPVLIPDKYSLINVNKKLFADIFNIIQTCQSRFADKCVGVLFMAIDLYLRYLSLGKTLPDYLSETCCLAALKYFYWSELNQLTMEQYSFLTNDDFIIREVKLYKVLDGKINEERYFNNAKSKKELLEVYKRFLYTEDPGEALIIRNRESGDINVNKLIVNYLAETKFFDRFDYSKRDNLNELTISSFFG